MKKQHLSIFALLCCSVLSAQVGINTESPASTLDVTAKNSTGTATTVDGLLIPRVSRQRAQLMQSVTTSTLIYVNELNVGTQTGNAVNIDTVGYYYFDSTVWVKLNAASGSGVNIYNANGSLTNNRTVTQNANTLAFNGTATNAFSVDGTTLSVDAANHRIGMGTAAPTNKLHVDGTNPLKLVGLQAGATTNNILTVDATGVVKQTPSAGIKGLLVNTYTAIGTTETTINQGVTASIPGVVITFTPTVNTTAIITVSSLPLANTIGKTVQGSVDILQNTVKIASQYYSATDGNPNGTGTNGGLSRLGNYSTTTRQVNLDAGTEYTFAVEAKSWFGATTFNVNPYPGYSGSISNDTNAMKTIMNISLYTR